MMMSRGVIRLASDFDTLVPNANRHRPFRCAHIAALPAKAGSLTAGQRRPVWKEPRYGFLDIHHRAG